MELISPPNQQDAKDTPPLEDPQRINSQMRIAYHLNAPECARIAYHLSAPECAKS